MIDEPVWTVELQRAVHILSPPFARVTDCVVSLRFGVILVDNVDDHVGQHMANRIVAETAIQGFQKLVPSLEFESGIIPTDVFGEEWDGLFELVVVNVVIALPPDLLAISLDCAFVIACLR